MWGKSMVYRLLEGVCLLPIYSLQMTLLFSAVLVNLSGSIFKSYYQFTKEHLVNLSIDRKLHCFLVLTLVEQ